MNFSLPSELSAQFHIERVLKQTDSNTVLLLRHKDTGHRRICKQFRGDAAACRLLMDADCPNLPRMELVLEEDGLVTTLEEYIQGDTLAFLLKGGPLSQKQSADILSQLCCALSALHDLGIIHRDIKPENIIIRGDTPVLIDFNASRVEKHSVSCDTVLMGTAGYAAPEQYGFAQTDARSDIYAMGVLLNIMLTGQHPATHLTDGPYSAVVKRCVEVNADRRYQTARELAAALKPTKKPMKTRLAVLLLLCLLLAAALRMLPTETPDQSPAPLSISPTSFVYDLDGDGIVENYLFGITFLHPKIQYGTIIYHDLIGIESEAVFPGRRAVPFIWSLGYDGTWVMRPDVCALLTDANITIQNIDDPDAVPVTAPFHHTLKGAVQVEFSPDPLGTWVYTATAKLGELELTANAATQIQLTTP